MCDGNFNSRVIYSAGSGEGAFLSLSTPIGIATYGQSTSEKLHHPLRKPRAYCTCVKYSSLPVTVVTHSPGLQDKRQIHGKPHSQTNLSGRFFCAFSMPKGSCRVKRSVGGGSDQRNGDPFPPHMIRFFQVPPDNHLHRVDHIVGRVGGRAKTRVQQLTESQVRVVCVCGFRCRWNKFCGISYIGDSKCLEASIQGLLVLLLCSSHSFFAALRHPRLVFPFLADAALFRVIFGGTRSRACSPLAPPRRVCCERPFATSFTSLVIATDSSDLPSLRIPGLSCPCGPHKRPARRPPSR